MTTPTIPASEVAEVLRRIARGDVQVRLQAGTESWYETLTGNVFFDADGWRIVIFNDCGFVDYVDSVVAPDGRTAKYEDWAQDKSAKCLNPISMMMRTEDAPLFEKLVAAR